MFGQPFGSNYTDLQNHYMQQLQAMQQAQQAQQKTQPILDEINREAGSLSLDEQKVLAQMPEYQMAKQTYEAGFMSFLGTKFSQEFVSSADGKVAADNLLATIRKSKEHIHAQLKAKEDKVNTLLELVEQDPEMKEKSADGFVVNILNKPVRFGEDDVNQLVEIFKTFKQNN